jgi:hypothetical protein
MYWATFWATFSQTHLVTLHVQHLVISKVVLSLSFASNVFAPFIDSFQFWKVFYRRHVHPKKMQNASFFSALEPILRLLDLHRTTATAFIQSRRK